VLSDLHLEHAPYPGPPADADAIVLAGDISTGTRGVSWAREWAADRPVLYVAGNHEFYGQELLALTGPGAGGVARPAGGGRRRFGRPRP